MQGLAQQCAVWLREDSTATIRRRGRVCVVGGTARSLPRRRLMEDMMFADRKHPNDIDLIYMDTQQNRSTLDECIRRLNELTMLISKMSENIGFLVACQHLDGRGAEDNG